MDRFRLRAQALRQSQTQAEARLWQVLRGRKLDRWKFRRQHPIDRFVVDFVSLAGKLVVEVDGATHSTGLEQMRDEARTRILEACGYRVLRVTNDEVYRNLAGVIDTIWADLNSGEG